MESQGLTPGFFGQLFKKESEEVNIDKVKKRLGKEANKIAYLKRIIDDPKNKGKEKEIRKLLIEELKKPKAEFNLKYDSFSQGLEPVYFWILDFMKKLGYDVNKTRDDFEASVGGLFYGDIGTRASVVQDRAMKMSSTINTVIRSMINLIYDLREFDIRLGAYDDLKSKEVEKKKAADLSLRGIWMDQVDIKRGRGSINSLAQNLQFVTLRDAFLYAEDLKAVDKIDLNDRVKRILAARLDEYFRWREFSEKELRKRYDIEKAYLKSQLNALKLYAEWAKPYFIAAQKLSMSSFDSANIVSVFNNLEIHLSILGKKKINVQDEIYKGNLPKKTHPSQDYYSCIEVEFVFRTVPQTIRQTQAATQFSQGGRVDAKLKAFVLSDKDLEYMKQQELFYGLEIIEGMIDTSLIALRDDLDKYIKDEKGKEDKKQVGLFNSIIQGFKDLKEPFSLFKGISFSTSGYQGDETIIKIAENAAMESCFTVYDIYKKAHGMLSW